MKPWTKAAAVIAGSVALLAAGSYGIYLLRSHSSAKPTAGASKSLFPSQSASCSMPLELKNPRVLITKSLRRLELFDSKRLVKGYRIGLGRNPVDDKQREGDGCTPEGKFYICMRNRDSAYYLSLGLSYPAPEDAARGLRSKLISKEEYNDIVKAANSGAQPPWNTRLGGEIFIHGNGATKDWTLGCIALDNVDMLELFNACPQGTPIEIRR